jgi:hypothetical protein
MQKAFKLCLPFHLSAVRSIAGKYYNAMENNNTFASYKLNGKF